MEWKQAYGRKDSMLLVDGDAARREALKEIFEEGFTMLEADSGAAGLAMMERHIRNLGAILVDGDLPEMADRKLLHAIHRKGFHLRAPVFLLTDSQDLDLMRDAYALGVQGILNKPLVPFIVEHRVEVVVELFRARESLANRVRLQERKLEETVKTIDALHRNTLEAMASAIEFRDVESGAHTNRIYAITKLLLQRTEIGDGFTAEEIENMAIGSIMHDVGKIAISDVILNKPGRLTRDEYEAMKLHTVKGAELMARLSRIQDHPSYRYALDIARHHHERWDGNGYPDGLRGDEITVWAQVVSIADVYDALVSPRVYKKAYSADTAVEMICNDECGVFNPRLLRCFLEVEPELRQLYQQEPEDIVPGGADWIPAVPAQEVEARDPMDMILLTAAVQEYFDMIICANLTTNTFTILDYNRFQTHCAPKTGAFDELIAGGAQSIPENHRQAFLDCFSREKLLLAYEAGEREVRLIHPQYTDDGAVMQVATHVILLEDPRTGHVRDITLVRYADALPANPMCPGA